MLVSINWGGYDGIIRVTTRFSVNDRWFVVAAIWQDGNTWKRAFAPATPEWAMKAYYSVCDEVISHIGDYPEDAEWDARKLSF